MICFQYGPAVNIVESLFVAHDCEELCKGRNCIGASGNRLVDATSVKSISEVFVEWVRARDPFWDVNQRHHVLFQYDLFRGGIQCELSVPLHFVVRPIPGIIPAGSRRQRGELRHWLGYAIWADGQFDPLLHGQPALWRLAGEGCGQDPRQ